VVDATGSSTSGAAAASFAAAAITTVTANAVAIWLWSTPDDNDLNAETQGTRRTTTRRPPARTALMHASTSSSDGRSTGPRAITQATNGNDNWVSATLALRPAADAPDPSASWFPGSGVSVAVEVAFDTDPLTGTAVWTDITSDVLEFSTSRGRSNEYEQTSPGTARFRLANADRKYDPEYTAGAYYQKLTPMREVRVRTRYSGTTFDLWRGFIQSWPQVYDIGDNWCSCEPSAIDGLSVLANRRFSRRRTGRSSPQTPHRSTGRSETRRATCS